MKRVLELQEELFAMPEWQRLGRLEHFQISVRLLEGNADELLEALDRLTADPGAFEAAGTRRRPALDAAFEQLLRFLHNLVASVSSLLDHARALASDLYPHGVGFEEVSKEIETRFVNNPFAQFVTDLRQLAQHHRLPHLGIKVKAAGDPGGGAAGALYLERSDLRKFAGWSSHAKLYLEAAPNQLDLRSLVGEYIRLARDFHRWLGGKQQGVRDADLAAVAAKQAEAHRELAEHIPWHLETGLDLLAKGIGNLRDVFATGLGPQDEDALAGAADDAQWIERVLAIFAERFGPLPDALVDRIRGAVSIR